MLEVLLCFIIIEVVLFFLFVQRVQRSDWEDDRDD